MVLTRHPRSWKRFPLDNGKLTPTRSHTMGSYGEIYEKFLELSFYVKNTFYVFSYFINGGFLLNDLNHI